MERRQQQGAKAIGGCHRRGWWMEAWWSQCHCQQP
jgi:hypothetical protein